MRPPFRPSNLSMSHEAWLAERTGWIRSEFDEPGQAQAKHEVLAALETIKWKFYDGLPAGIGRPKKALSQPAHLKFKKALNDGAFVEASTAEVIRVLGDGHFNGSMRDLTRKNGWDLKTIPDPTLTAEERGWKGLPTQSEPVIPPHSEVQDGPEGDSHRVVMWEDDREEAESDLDLENEAA